jgi:hypothetical protein
VSSQQTHKKITSLTVDSRALEGLVDLAERLDILVTRGPGRGRGSVAGLMTALGLAHTGDPERVSRAVREILRGDGDA